MNIKSEIVKNRPLQTVIIFILVVLFFMSFFPDKDSKYLPQQSQQTTDAGFKPEQQEKTKADTRTDVQKLHDLITAIKSIDTQLDNADNIFKQNVREAIADDSPEILRSAFDTYDNEILRLDASNLHLSSTDFRTTNFKTDDEGIVMNHLLDAMEAQSRGIDSRRKIAKNFDKIEPGNLASALTYTASENVNREDISRSMKKELAAISAAQKAAIRIFTKK